MNTRISLLPDGVRENSAAWNLQIWHKCATTFTRTKGESAAHMRGIERNAIRTRITWYDNRRIWHERMPKPLRAWHGSDAQFWIERAHLKTPTWSRYINCYCCKRLTWTIYYDSNKWCCTSFAGQEKSGRCTGPWKCKKNRNETERYETNRNETKRNETHRKEMKPTEIKRNKKIRVLLSILINYLQLPNLRQSAFSSSPVLMRGSRGGRGSGTPPPPSDV